jgi:hypothetical protein
MKLSLDALKNRAEAVASEELLDSISGGVQEACHDGGSVGFWASVIIGVTQMLHDH